MPPLDPNLLVALDVLLAERSVTRAARRLGVTQSAMSHKLRALRERLGDPLVVASKQGLIPTERALAMAAPLRQALLDLQAVPAIGAAFDPATTVRTFRVSSSDYGELIAIPRVAALVEQAVPGVDLQLEPPYPDLGERLADGRLDAAVAPAIPMQGAIRRTKLSSDGFTVALRAGHPAAKGRWTLERYCALRHLVIAPRGARGSVVDDLLAKRELSRRVALRVSSFVAAPFIVATTDLCLTAPSGLIAELAPRLGLVTRAPPLEIPAVDSFLYWHTRVDSDPAHRWLRSLMLSVGIGRPPSSGRVTHSGGAL